MKFENITASTIKLISTVSVIMRGIFPREKKL